ncbi:MAG: ATP-dependent 6-phosphofructokinase [Lachnospiraceae bacterium]|nr:ATP-dependent 6-phosphofructokinase [Lachnospiraceae bacterium]
MLRVGILTSGGDCQGLNAAIRAVGKALYLEFGKDVEIYGLRDGYKGLITGDVWKMTPNDFSGIINLGGTILGTSREPYKLLISGTPEAKEKIEGMKSTYKKLKLDCLVILGGNGTHKTANLLSELGMHVITLPKTIDNDLWGTDVTFGFQSAVAVAANVLDSIHTTATSHGRVFIVEIMGHKVGWLTLYAGIAGSANAILLPEIPYDTKVLARMIDKRSKNGKRFSIIAIAEGAMSKDEAKLNKREFRSKREQQAYPSVAYQLADELGQLTGHEVRVAVPGHIQRGGSPCPYDRVLATRFGAAAAKLIADKNWGNMVGMRDGVIVPVPLKEVAGKLKTVPLDNDVIQTARDIGITFGDK